jgi:hypothetical protein
VVELPLRRYLEIRFDAGRLALRGQTSFTVWPRAIRPLTIDRTCTDHANGIVRSSKVR